MFSKNKEKSKKCENLNKIGKKYKERENVWKLKNILEWESFLKK